VGQGRGYGPPGRINIRREELWMMQAKSSLGLIFATERSCQRLDVEGGRPFRGIIEISMEGKSLAYLPSPIPHSLPRLQLLPAKMTN
jgi:hypothetical protein